MLNSSCFDSCSNICTSNNLQSLWKLWTLGMTGKEFNNIFSTLMLEKRKTVSRPKIQLFYRRALTALFMEHRQCSLLDKALGSQGITHTNEFNYQCAFMKCPCRNCVQSGVLKFREKSLHPWRKWHGFLM